ncbi:MAG TPA: hypothetical protein VJ741_02230 [Solirubrobacteraceae bacterium]|nr:hypothetical protein [Solirubrobacteraceae bacterium]
MPFDLIAAGTSFATAALAPPLEELAADVEVDVEVDAGAAGAALEDALLLLLLLPHAAKSAAHDTMSAASSGLHLVTIRLLLVVKPQIERDQHMQENAGTRAS